MTRSSKMPNSSQSRSPLFGTFSAVAAAMLFLFLYLSITSLFGDPPPPDPAGSWKQVHQALGISLDVSPASARKSTLMKPSPRRILPLRIAGPGGNLEIHKDGTELIQDLPTTLRSISGRLGQRQ